MELYYKIFVGTLGKWRKGKLLTYEESYRFSVEDSCQFYFETQLFIVDVFR